MIRGGSFDRATAPQGLRPRGRETNSRVRYEHMGAQAPHPTVATGPGTGTPVTAPPLLSGGVAPQDGGDPLKHLGELLALLRGECLRHAPLNAPRALIGMQNQGLALGSQ